MFFAEFNLAAFEKFVGHFSPLLLSLLAFILVLSPLVFIHELGHYLVARANGVKVESFSIGFGPKLIGWTDKAGTQWKISLLLFGGYVKMLGDENIASSVSSDAAHHQQHTLASKKPWQKILIALAGPFANYLLAFFVLLTLLLTVGKPLYLPIIKGVMPQSLAAQQGVQKSERVVSINEKPIQYVKDFMQALQGISVNDPLKIMVQQPTAKITSPEMTNDTTTDKTYHFFKGQLPEGKRSGTWLGKLGIEFDSRHPSYEKVRAGSALFDILRIMNPLSMAKSIKLDSMGGPVGIAQEAGHVIQEGPVALFYFGAMISIALGFFNLLPIPLLDGGMVLFSFIEMIIRRPLSQRLQQTVTFIAFLVLGSLFIFLFWKDFQKIQPVYQWMKKFGLAR